MSRVQHRQVREVTERTAMSEVIGRMIGGKPCRLERQRGGDQQQDRKRP